MRVKRLALPAALAAAALALATFASPAFADDAATTIYPAPDQVTFSSSTTGSVPLDYLCAADVQPAILSVDLTNTYRGAEGVLTSTAGGSADAVCDGTRQSATVALELTAGDGIYSGALTLHATLGSAELTHAVELVRSGVVVPNPDPTPTDPPAPPLATVDLTTNASPESVIKGKKITIKGTIRRDGKKVKAKTKTKLEFNADSSGGYATVKSVTSSTSGALSTTVKASGSGSFRYVYAGSSTTESATSAGDHIVVKAKPKPKPKPKTYKNCTALHKVYPHGVGKSGAKDKGGDVTTFTRDSKTYAKNKKSDRDKDGIACEQD